MAKSTEKVRQGAHQAFATEDMTDNRDTVAVLEPNWRTRLDALLRGECSEDDFVDEVSAYSEAVPDAAWNVVALLDQHYRRGQVPADLFRSIESKIARRALHVPTSRRAPVPIPVPASEHAQLNVPAQPPRRFPVDFRSLRARAGAMERVAAPPAEAILYRLDGLAPDAGPELEVGQLLRDRYVIESLVASGGMGTVYKALDRVRREHSETDCHVAIKVLHDSALRKPSALAKLRREFYCAQSLSHPTVIKVFEIDRHGDLDFFSMEYLQGTPLSLLMEQCQPQPIPRERAWAVIREIAEGLAHAHARNIVHADLKPQNIMLLDSGDLRILDFGASSGSTLTAGKPAGLTPAYASCELLEGQRADPRDDVFALACLAGELLSGRHPFDYVRATEARQSNLKPARPTGLSNRQWQALESGLAWRRELRPSDIHEWVTELLPRSTRWGLAARAWAYLDAQWSREAAGVRMVGALVLVVVGMAALALAHRPRPKPDADVTALAKPGPSVSDIHAVAPTAKENRAVLTAAPSGAQRVSPDTGNVVAPGLMTSAPANSDSVTPAAATPTAVVPAPAQVRSPLPTPVPTVSRPSALVNAPTPHAKSVAPLKADAISMTSAVYPLPASANFAEIHVRRSTATADKASFVWWTQAGTAVPGTDFVPQDRAAVTFAPGKLTATLYIKLLPASRQRARTFSVVIGDVGGGASLGIAKSSVVLAPR